MWVAKLVGWISFAVACVAFVSMPDGALRLRIALASTVVAVIAGVIAGWKE
jgi:hypothetical protein